MGYLATTSLQGSGNFTPTGREGVDRLPHEVRQENKNYVG